MSLFFFTMPKSGKLLIACIRRFAHAILYVWQAVNHHYIARAGPHSEFSARCGKTGIFFFIFEGGGGGGGGGIAHWPTIKKISIFFSDRNSKVWRYL